MADFEMTLYQCSQNWDIKCVALNFAFTNTITTLFADSFTLQINLNIVFLLVTNN